ncbi:alpha/beta hydrolase [Mycobacterium sp. SMC-2]|uniref:alpha/beta fold hydrolase n=1 Tax=Mycobacterium sp. SMC-2 TaxID=2857058 RepID=UPI0021B4BAEC|nr:alpha/beta hydrolase [Mycobacterium sp. SMC-2]UXA05331.1 alpha/beta hydrolase [Mycobacterium sp. SMC-2]
MSLPSAGSEPASERSDVSAISSGWFGQKTPLEARWAAVERQDTPLLVCLHGGGYDNRYFDAPRCSLLCQASAAAFGVVSLSRPGYPADDDSARRQPSFSQAAEIIADVVTHIWDQLGEGRPGIVLIGHSIGAAIAIHVAAKKVSWPLIGLAISSVCDSLAPVVVELIGQLPTDVALSMPGDLIRPLFYGPDWTLNTTTLADVADLPVSTPSADLVELNTSWADDLPKVASRVEVPLHYVLAEFDGLWETSAERVATIAGLFSRAPFVEASFWRGVGHNIEHHRLGEAYGRAVLAFAERCAVETDRPKA